MASRGVVAAGHPLTAEAGARVLREGGNAVDAAVAACLASFSVESTLTGLGAGGFMIVGGPGVETAVIDFFVAAPGKGGHELTGELVPVPVHFDETTTQVFNVGAASCGVPGTAAGLSARPGALRLGADGGPDRTGGAARQGRCAAQPAAGLRAEDPRADLHLDPGSPGDLRPGRPDPLRGRCLPLPRPRRRPRALRGRGGERRCTPENVPRRIEEYILDRGGTLSVADIEDYEPILSGSRSVPGTRETRS